MWEVGTLIPAPPSVPAPPDFPIFPCSKREKERRNPQCDWSDPSGLKPFGNMLWIARSFISREKCRNYRTVFSSYTTLPPWEAQQECWWRWGRICPGVAQTSLLAPVLPRTNQGRIHTTRLGFRDWGLGFRVPNANAHEPNSVSLMPMIPTLMPMNPTAKTTKEEEFITRLARSTMIRPG